jgi:hypothetical protein
VYGGKCRKKGAKRSAQWSESTRERLKGKYRSARRREQGGKGKEGSASAQVTVDEKKCDENEEWVW